MKLRTFTVPFARVVGDEATELEFGPDDFIIVRPLFGLPRDEITAWSRRIESVEKAAKEAVDLPPDDPVRKAAEALSDTLILDVIRGAVQTWSLTGPDGTPIEMPKSPSDLEALPGGLAAALYPFLSTYRGEANPTTRS